MVDIHSHILYGLDDGAKTLEDSVAMVKLAAESGTTDIVATPHANLEFTFQPELIEHRIAELSQASGRVVRIHSGCDFHLHYDNIQDALSNPAKYSINHKRYLLVEFSEMLIVKTIEDVFYRMESVGLTPIITHPERNALIQQRLERLESWVNSGCLVQITAQSLLGRFGKKPKSFCDELLRRGLVHFVASDAHNIKNRPPVLTEAYHYIAKNYGETRAQALFIENPKATLTGDCIEWEPVEAPASARKWYQFWR